MKAQKHYDGHWMILGGNSGCDVIAECNGGRGQQNAESLAHAVNAHAALLAALKGLLEAEEAAANARDSYVNAMQNLAADDPSMEDYATASRKAHDQLYEAKVEARLAIAAAAEPKAEGKG